MSRIGKNTAELLVLSSVAVGLHDRTGEELVATTRPYGELPARHTNRDMVDGIVRTGKPHISNLFMGRALQRQILTVGYRYFATNGLSTC